MGNFEASNGKIEDIDGGISRTLMGNFDDINGTIRGQ